MSSSKKYNGVNSAVFACVKTASSKQHGTVYDPATGDKGTATTDTIVGKVVVGFDFDSGSDSITYTIQSKPFLVSDSQIFSGIADSINDCKAK